MPKPVNKAKNNTEQVKKQANNRTPKKCSIMAVHQVLRWGAEMKFSTQRDLVLFTGLKNSLTEGISVEKDFCD